MQRYVVGGVEMQLPIIVAAGACKTPQSILPYMRPDVPVGAVISGSYTPEPRPGNDGTLFFPLDWERFQEKGFGLNAYGMPNIGFDRASQEIPSESVHPLIASIAGFSVTDYMEGVMKFADHPGITALEINAGCPNAHDQKPLPMAYDLEFLSQCLRAIGPLQVEKPVWLKLSPYATSDELERLAELFPHLDFSGTPSVPDTYVWEAINLIARHPFVRAIVFSNTLPNVIFRSGSGQPVTSPNGGKAGLSGPIVKEISLRLIHQARSMLPQEVDLIGCGGNLSGDDIVDYLETGASGAQCASGPFWHGDGPRFFADLIAGSERLQNYLEPQETGG